MKERDKKQEFTEKQKQWIKERDDFTSGMRHYSEEKGFYFNKTCPYDNKPCNSLQIHHIKPVSLGGQATADNGITLFSCEHLGMCPERRIK